MIFVALHKEFLTSIVRCTIERHWSGSRGPSRQISYISLGKDIIVVKVEEIQQYGKEHFETVVASANTLQSGIQAIATAYGDYTKKSFEDGKSFVEKLAGVKSLDKVLEVQTEYAKPAKEPFGGESKKTAVLYADPAKQT